MPEQAAAQKPDPLFAQVRGDYALFIGPEKLVRERATDGDEVFPFVRPETADLNINFVDRAAGKVRAITRAEAVTDEEKAAWRQIERATAYPYLSDQVGAILKQLEMTTNPDARHPEFQAVLDAITQVKLRIP